MKISKKFKEFMDQQLESDRTPDIKKLIIYLILGDAERTEYHIRNALDLGYRVRLPKTEKPPDNNLRLRPHSGRLEVNHAIYLRILHENPEKVEELFEWAVENCTLPDDFIEFEKETGRYDDLSFAFLWGGYARLALGRYAEALEYLSWVVPFSTKWKKLAGEIYYIVEYALPKALIPLCEFKLNPTRQNLVDAQKGIEEYISSLREPRFRLDGYLYYFHLKEQFADVYDADPSGYPEVAQEPDQKPLPEPGREIEIAASLPGEEEEYRYIWIWDLVSLTVGEEFGTDEELGEYVDNVSKLDGFPELSSLVDRFMLWDEVDALALCDETERLLAMPDIDPQVREKTGIIREVACYSATKGSGRLVLKPEEEG